MSIQSKARRDARRRKEQREHQPEATPALAATVIEHILHRGHIAARPIRQ